MSTEAEFPPTLSWGAYRAALAFLAEEGNEYAGIPVKPNGTRVTVHPSYRFHSVFAADKDDEGEGLEPHEELVNRWISHHKHGCECYIIRNKNTGKVSGGYIPMNNRLEMTIATLSCMDAWTLKAERKAIDLLAAMLTPRMFSSYMLTGGFIETSKRSQITYFFRRLRPTIAIKATEANSHCLCALCLHPIGYYSGTWGGVMVPTDEVVAHLTLMRGDEYLYWKQANQHPAWLANAGI